MDTPVGFDYIFTGWGKVDATVMEVTHICLFLVLFQTLRNLCCVRFSLITVVNTASTLVLEQHLSSLLIYLPLRKGDYT